MYKDIICQKPTISDLNTYLLLITTAGVTLYVRKLAGMTLRLKKHTRLIILVDGLYLSNPWDACLHATGYCLSVTASISQAYCLSSYPRDCQASVKRETR